MLTARTIESQHSDVFTFLRGNLDNAANHCDIPEEAAGDSLVYISDAEQLAKVQPRKPAILVLAAKMVEHVQDANDIAGCCFAVQSVPMGMAVLLKYFDRKSLRFTQWGERHPSAVVHADAHIGQDVFLGPYCVIGAHASIGEGCLIGAHAVIEAEDGPIRRRIARSEDDLLARMPSASEKAALDLPDGVPVVSSIRAIYDDENRAVEVQDSVASADTHQYRYEVDMR